MGLVPTTLNKINDNRDNAARKSLYDKKTILKKYLVSNQSVSKFGEENNIIPRLLRYTINNSNNIMNIDSDNSFMEMKNLKIENKYGHIDEFIINKIGILRRNGGIVTKAIIKTLGENYILETPECKIKITDYFIRRFIKKNKLMYKFLHGESKSVNTENIGNFFESYKLITQDYEEKNIFNRDETGFFIKNIGKRSFILSKSDNKNVKIDKTRITVGLTISRLNEQLPSLIIGRSAKPRCLKNFDLSELKIFYRSNKNAWLTQSIFLEYLTFLNDLMISQNRKILFLLDNASGHKVNSLSNIKLVELPANTTSILQPLDQGIIKSFKNYYTNQLNNFICAKMIGSDLNIKAVFLKLTLLDVFYWIKDALNMVSINTVKNCWGVFDKFNEKSNESPLVTENEPDEKIYNDLNIIHGIKYEEKETNEDIFDDTTNTIFHESTFFHISILEQDVVNWDTKTLLAFYQFKNALIALRADKIRKIKLNKNEE